MKRGKIKKTFLVCLLILTAFFLVILLINLQLKKDRTTADIISQSDIKTVALNQPEADYRSEITIPILMYHHIRDYNDANDSLGTNLSVSIDNFNQQLNYLSDNGYTTITFTELAKFPNQALPEKPIILTFDDGYDDNYQAYKMLKAKNLSAVFFIISDYIGRAGHLNQEQILEIAYGGMEVGSHSKKHLDLTKVSPDTLLEELSASKQFLENLTGKEVISFCYPSGKYNALVREKAEIVGYKFAVTTEPGIASTSDQPLILKRVRITDNQSLENFAKRLKSND